MITKLKTAEQDVWDAWIEFDHSGSSHFGTLYISGIYDAAPGTYRSSTKRITTEYGTQLILELPARPENGGRLKDLFYTEPVKNPGQYHSICVYAGDELLARFTQIDTLI